MTGYKTGFFGLFETYGEYSGELTSFLFILFWNKEDQTFFKCQF